MYQEVAASYTHMGIIIGTICGAGAHTCASTMRGTARTWPDWDIPSEPPDDTLFTTRSYVTRIFYSQRTVLDFRIIKCF